MPTTFTIPKGKHSARGLHIGIHSRDKFRWAVQFDSTAKYLLGPNQADINKLCGIKYFSGDNSARFGWRSKGMQVELLAYVHDAGVVTKSESEVVLCSIGINQWYDLALNVTDEEYEFYVTQGSKVLGQGRVAKTHDYKWSYRQNPYFGGVIVAPHDIKIQLKNQ